MKYEDEYVLGWQPESLGTEGIMPYLCGLDNGCWRLHIINGWMNMASLIENVFREEVLGNNDEIIWMVW